MKEIIKNNNEISKRILCKISNSLSIKLDLETLIAVQQVIKAQRLIIPEEDKKLGFSEDYLDGMDEMCNILQLYFAMLICEAEKKDNV